VDFVSYVCTRKSERGRTQWPNLSGDVLELADALGNGVGCPSSMRVLWRVVSVNWPTAVLLLLSIGQRIVPYFGHFKDVRGPGCACAESPS
jgi:hypothetical protein